MRGLAILSAAGLLFAGCGGGGVVPSAAALGSGAPPVTITNAGEGKTVQVRVGQVVNVALKAADGMDNWLVSNPDPAILAPTVNPAAAAAKSMTLRAFKAVGAGRATINATDRPACNPGQACSRFIQAFKATVVVGSD